MRLARQAAASRPWLLLELESEAALALVKAARKFDPARGLKFSTWACGVISRKLASRIRAESRHPAPGQAVEGEAGPVSPIDLTADTRPAGFEAVDAAHDLPVLVARLDSPGFLDSAAAEAGVSVGTIRARVRRATLAG